ncbi:serine hydrolase [Fulvivirgaceae bacterium BMA12]|uniref:Serine hydrolase n=1 Tax=Agaribacillus aureus TaxID=3051825 RepID=A0ABT8L9A2_9BACT|nr:serine hydrolase [Fulvivirgaceae bacterium BMA12]
MIIKRLKNFRSILLYLGALYAVNVSAQSNFKNKNWKQYTDVAEVGFSANALNLLRKKLDSSQTASFLVVFQGHILFSHGENTRKFMLHSIRKSIMNAMIGIAIENGTMRLDQTLKALGINDIGQLSDLEREATLKDLLSARSGVYHPSAYATRGMIKNLPERGSHDPGTFWYYNNWDFNVLLTIYEQQTGKKFFEAFYEEIAKPIGMEDFELSDGYYRLEADKSMHPAYLFRMSTRDMARFGQLYLQKGRWNNQQLIAADWIEQSTQPVTTDLRDFSVRGGYGFLWWVSTINHQKMYNASGSGGHKIIVLPESGMVIVHRVNTYENKKVSEDHIHELVSLVLNARTRSEKINTGPRLYTYTPPAKVFKTSYHQSMDRYLGTYKHKFLGKMTIKKEPAGYVLENGVGIFKLYPASDSTFIPGDIENLIVMEKALETTKRYTIEAKFGSGNPMSRIIFYY